MALTVTSCKDDDTTFNITEDLDRLPMPMFRRKFNTNIAEENDMYSCKLVEGYQNRIQLHWYGIEGAAGYEIRYMISGNGRDQESDWHGTNVTYVTVPADQLSLVIKDLQYNATPYIFCIRALHPDGKEEHHSKWYGMGGGREWEDYLIIPTGERYATPSILQIDGERTGLDEFTLMVDPTWNYGSRSRAASMNQQDIDTIESRFNIVNGKFTFTHIVVQPTSANPNAKVSDEYRNGHLLTEEELTPWEDGYIRIRVTGLDQSSLYSVTLRDDSNPKATADADRYYTFETVRTKGIPGAPILIKHRVASSIWIDPEATTVPDMDAEQKWFDAEHKYNACRLDTVITNFNSDMNLAEGQIFLLEGGKSYYLRNTTMLCKGFTLKTDPATLDQGRATVYLGGLYRNDVGACVGAANWNLGKNPEEGEFITPIRLEKVIFEDIDFDCPQSVNFGENSETKAGLTGNYFANMGATGLPVEFESFEMRNCTFQGILRGFFRIQGNNKRVINHIIMENNVLFNCGFYSTKGVDYNIIHGEAQSSEENICGDLQLINNTFYDTPMGSISPTKNKTPTDGFGPNVHWNIRVENNTFINHCTRSDAAFLNMREVPDQSTVTFKNNLIVLTRATDDKRRLGFCGIDVRNVSGNGDIDFDICNNYSASSEADYQVDDAIITNKSYRFSANKNAPGYWVVDGKLGPNTAEDLVVKVGSTPLTAADVFNDPNPKTHFSASDDATRYSHYADPATIWNRLQYTNSAKLTEHEIYTKNIGAQRWRTGDPKSFRVMTATDATLAAPAE